MNVLIQSLPIATAALEGPEMKLIAVNEPMLKLWGRSGDVLGKPLLGFMPELANQEFPALLQEVYHTAVPHQANEASVNIKVGEVMHEVFMDYTYNPLRNAAGDVYGVLVTAVDATERIASRRRLLESERNFKNLVLHAPVAMCVLKGPEHVVDIANEKMFELWGKNAAEMLHKPIFIGLPEAKSQGFEEILYNVYTTGESYKADEQPVNLPRDGKIGTAFISFVYDAFRDQDGVVTGIVVVATDVTDMVFARHRVEEAEERARLAIEAADMGTFDLDMQTGQLITSPRFDAIFGFDKPVRRDEYLDRVHPDDMGIRDIAHQNALKTGKLFYEIRLFEEDANYHWIRVEGQVYYDLKNKPLRMLGTVVDITNEKTIQQQKDDFIGVASHELKTPLTSLRASLQLLNRRITDPPPDAALLLDQSNKSLGKLSSLVENLLNVTKLKEGGIQLDKTWFRVADLVDECCSHVRMSGTHDIIYDGDPELNVFADRFTMNQVMANLVNNVVKYAPNSKTIRVRSEKLSDVVKISVEDKGPGIPPDKINHLFDRYFQLESKRAQFTGVGLGLYISTQIIKKHGGEIGVQSELGKGSIFWFTIPV